MVGVRSVKIEDGPSPVVGVDERTEGDVTGGC